MEIVKFKVEKGEIYANWLILESGTSYKKVLCKCLLCNREFHRWIRGILSGKSISCGCDKNKRKNLTPGAVFGYWKVLNVPISGSYVTVICLGCEITTKEIDVHFLFKQRSTSCGCRSKEAYKNTCLKLVGKEAYAQSDVHKQKKKQVMFEKYGYEHALQVEEFKKKAKQTTLDRYNTENYSGTQECKQKSKDTNLQKYGVEHYRQLPQERNKLKLWCELNPEKLFTSKGEFELLTFIQSYYPSATKFKKKDLELDIFIPELNIGVEYNGLYWHNEDKIGKNYHLNKTKYFTNLGIRTIHIWEHEWQTKQKQVKSFLLSAINKNEHKLGARKCNIVWSNSKEEIQKAHRLLDDTHIQGHTNSTKYVANVYDKGELLATATFGKHLRNSKEWVLTRFTTKTNHTISGILSKISRLASKELNSDIISWADYRLSEGKGYIKAGWEKQKLHPPDYFYWTNNLKIISKQSRQKNLVKTPEGMTEKEHAKLDGLLRVYDCGKIRFKYKRHSNL